MDIQTTGKTDNAELVAKVIALYAAGNTQKEIHKSLDIGLVSVNHILNDSENVALIQAARKTIKERLINESLEKVAQAFQKNCDIANEIIEKNLTNLNKSTALLLPKEIQSVAIVMDIAHKNLRLARGESTENVSQNVRHFSFEQIKNKEHIDIESTTAEVK